MSDCYRSDLYRFASRTSLPAMWRGDASPSAKTAGYAAVRGKGDHRYEASSTVAFRPVGDELLMLDLTRDIHFSLNETGSQIWLRLCSGQSLGEVVEAIAGTHGTDPDVVAMDVDETVRVLIEAGLLREAC